MSSSALLSAWAGPAYRFQVSQGWQGNRPCWGWGCSVIQSLLLGLPFVPYPLPGAFLGQERSETSREWQSRVPAVSWGVLAGLVASVKISLWWSVRQTLPAPDPGWAHKSLGLAQLSVPHSRPACPHPRAHSGLLPRQAAARTLAQAPLQPASVPLRGEWAGDGGRPSPGPGQPSRGTLGAVNIILLQGVQYVT